jgi:hypothetical protein
MTWARHHYWMPENFACSYCGQRLTTVMHVFTPSGSMVPFHAGLCPASEPFEPRPRVGLLDPPDSRR